MSILKFKSFCLFLSQSHRLLIAFGLWFFSLYPLFTYAVPAFEPPLILGKYTVKATLTSFICGDHCMITYQVNEKSKASKEYNALCHDLNYCEKWGQIDDLIHFEPALHVTLTIETQNLYFSKVQRRMTVKVITKIVIQK